LEGTLIGEETAMRMRNWLRSCCCLGLLTGASLIACTMQNATVPEDVLMNQFQFGTATLNCGASCELAWATQRPQALALYNSGQWRSLALLVMRTGYGNDLSWYYLGRAAQGFSYLNAAQRYYGASESLAASGPACAAGSSVAQNVQSFGAQLLSQVSNATA
jgi:hypothetical protein